MDINAPCNDGASQHQNPQKSHGDVQGAHLADKIHQARRKTVVIVILIVVLIADGTRLRSRVPRGLRGMGTLIGLDHIIVKAQKFQRVLRHAVIILIIKPIVLKQFLKPDLPAVILCILSPVFLILHVNS